MLHVLFVFLYVCAFYTATSPHNNNYVYTFVHIRERGETPTVELCSTVMVVSYIVGVDITK